MIPLFTRRSFLTHGTCATALLSFANSLRAETGWPRTLTNADGSETVLNTPPMRVVSTSVTLTGGLLAVDAPVVASATTVRGAFFAQWQSVAESRNVAPLWRAGSIDLESVWAHEPDLIVVSATGADSALMHRAALEEIAPVLVLDYGALDWQGLSRQLGHATGKDERANGLLESFAQSLETTRATLHLPGGQTNIVSYNGPGAPNPIATADGTHGRLLTALGFRMEDPPRSWQGADTPPAADFIRAAYEHLTELTAETTFLLAGTDTDAERFMADPILSNLPSVKNRQVYGLGANSFRIDYYSANEIVADIARRFAKA
ncbi:Fe2+-enterobactin ABC transporter substrate-binding protein [Falsirhodobacter sp. alg1]|uniref:Fe2+-enterobactin ABC transporter substrate-binding protein n=1 Tax=Falsirhodobacter sp. alg1 TaxID=1472418 RepID=UPI0005EF9C1F|nr:Fe2+-enterobactin ABC transporter substrate-binding protein [Falsirhodobacter sp. alg1]